jgi:hypothetical protein
MKVVSDIDLKIKEAVDKVQMIDTHEHLLQEKERITRKFDLFETLLAHYASSDLISSGMPPEDLERVRSSKLALKERWTIFEPYWERIQNTGYAKALNIAVRDLYGVDGINEKSFEKLASKMEDANKSGLYQWILKEKSGIDISILDSLSVPIEEVDRKFFAPVTRFDDFVMIKERTDLEALAKRTGKPIHSFSDFIGALEFAFEKASKLIVGVKIGLAYLRSIHFEKTVQSEAEEVFVNIFRQKRFRRVQVNNKTIRVPEGLSIEEAKPLQDYVVHKIIQMAITKGLPIQIHTGIQEGNENIITNSDPTLLINLFREYKEAKFDIFHGSYPYTSELAVLAKNFPNVYIDMCWLHIISPYKARIALAEWLDTIPWNKILGFGGDYILAEGVYGHQVIARQNIAKVLTEKVVEDYFTQTEAIVLAEKLLRDNAKNLFFSSRPFS